MTLRRLDIAASASELADREQIRDLMMRYARAIDRIDIELLRSTYWPGATDNHGPYSGDVEGFIAWVEGVLRGMDQTMHAIANILIRIDGDQAAVETYFHAYHRLTGPAGDPIDSIAGGRYLDRLERRDGEWRIAGRDVVYDWYRDYPDSGAWPTNALGLHFETNHAPGDPSCALFAAPGRRLPALEEPR